MEHPTNILPAGGETIPLPSEKCQEKFRVSHKVDVLLLDETTAKRRQVLNEHGGLDSPKPHVLPKGEKPIRLPSEECEAQFHVSDHDVDVPLLDETTAKRRQVLNEHGGIDDPKPHILPKGEKPIRLTSGECEEKFHVTSATAVPLLPSSHH